MKKFLQRSFSAVLALLCLMSAAVLSGCHGSRGMPRFELPEEFDTSKTYELTFWSKNDTNITQVKAYEAAIAAFEALYPNIKINMVKYTDYVTIYNNVITNIPTRTTPDICITYPDHIATYITGADTVVALDELMADGKYGLGGSELRFDGPGKDGIIRKYLDECTLAGKTYALPFVRSTEACYINVDFVEKLGYTVPDVLTWDFIWEVSDAAAAKNADGTYVLNGQKTMIPFIYKSTDNMMIQMLRQRGAGYSDADGNILMFNDVTHEILYDVAEHTGTGAFSTFKISSYPANFLNAGQCVFAVDSTAGATWMGSDAPLCDISKDKIIPFETAVRMIPQYDPDSPQMISQGPSVCIFNKEDPQRVLASWLFTQFLLTNDVQLSYAETEGYVPVTKKAAESAEYADYLARAGEDGKEHYDVKIAASKLLLDHVDDTFTTPVFNGSASLRTAAGQLIEEVTKSVRRHKVVDDEYMESLSRDVVSLYHLDQNGKWLTEGQDLGPLPAFSAVLLAVLAAVWIGLAAWFIVSAVKKRKAGKN